MTLLAIVTLLLMAHRGHAASVTAVCTYAEWTFNSQEQSPCQVWANLQAACNPNASVGKLDTSTNIDAVYPPPTGAGATACQCNVVAYNLMAGCSWCQPNVYSSNWVTESQWKAGCSSYDSTGKLPPQASSLSSQVPTWALQVENGHSWEDFDASSIAAGGTLPTATLTAPNGLNSGFGTATSFGNGPFPTVTGGGGGDDEFGDGIFVSSKSIAKVVGIAVAAVLGCYLVLYAFVLGVFIVRQKNRKAWYGPTAEYYHNGGRMGDLHAAQPLLSGTTPSPNPFTTPSPSPGNPSTNPTSPYQPISPQPSQYDRNANHGHGYPAAPYQPPSNVQYDPNINHGYPHHYDTDILKLGTPHTGSSPQIPIV